MPGSKGRRGRRHPGVGATKRRIAVEVRVVALFEAAKGFVVLLAGVGLLALIHRNVQAVGEEIVRHLHFNPAKHLPHVFVDAMTAVTDARLWMMALAALVYALVRLVEAYGLWRQQTWAEWFGILSGSIYLPVELYELTRSVTVVKVSILLVNIAVVGWLAQARWLDRKKG